MKNIKYVISRLIKKLSIPSIKNSFISKFSKVEAGSQVVNSTFEKHSFCGYNCTILNTKIGKYTSIASDVKIGLVQHPIDWLSTSPVFYKGRDSIKTKISEFEFNNKVTTIIGNDVWIGEGCFIKQGVIVGDGSIVGMGSVVTKDVEPYAIVVGNPAKLIKYRFSIEIIAKLENLKWWDLDEELLRKKSSKVTNIDAFLAEFEK